jgi:hypothetical protein
MALPHIDAIKALEFAAVISVEHIENNDLDAIKALTERTNTLEQMLGPEYDTVIDGLDQVDLNTAEGQQLADVFKTPQVKCE